MKERELKQLYFAHKSARACIRERYTWLCRMYVRTMACRTRRVRAKCDEEAAELSRALTSLLASQWPNILDAVYHPDGVTPVYLDNCIEHREST